MLKNIFKDIKNTSDGVAVKKMKASLIKGAEDNGINMRALLTPAVDKKLEDLIQTIIDEHGYKKLASEGLKTYSKK
ncbi:MAG: hypothetical protein ABR534_15595 [Desulfotignum sp.]